MSSPRRTYRTRRTTIAPGFRPSSRALWHPARRHPRARIAPAPPEPGAPFLPGELDGGRLLVEVAWGADLTADPGTWVWTDISGDVRYEEQIATVVGRSDESSAAQPASCVMTLDNRANLYSPHNPICPNWPNVRRGTPVRVRLRTATAAPYQVRFQGEAAAWKPRWDTTGVNAATVLEAAGVLRRLEQGTAPVLSTLRRAITEASGVHAYWPCEEPKGATAISSGLSGAPGMAIVSSTEVPYPKWEANDEIVCSAPLPEVDGTTWRGVVPPHTETGDVQVRFVLGVPAAGATGTEQTLLSIYTTGTVLRWDLRYHPGGSLSFDAYDTAGAQVVNQGAVAFDVDGSRRRISLELEQSGADVVYRIQTVPLDVFAGGGLQLAATLTTDTVGRATAIVVNPSGLFTDVVLGHITVESAITSSAVDQADFNARLAELGTPRLQRLCDGAGIPLTLVGADNGPNMGPQPPAPLLDLLREVETAYAGVLHDGLSAGLTFVSYAARYAAAAALTLDAAAHELAGALEPLDDDKATRNDVTVRNLRGAQFRARDITGPLGTDVVGTFDTSLDVSTFYDRSALDVAGWRLNLGTVPGFRHPRLELNVRRNPEVAAAWAAVTLASRIDVENIADSRPAHPPGTVSLMVEGWSETLDQFHWDVEVNCSPYDPWRVGVVAADVGDVGEFVLRAADSGTSTMAATAAGGASSLSVATSAGDPLWSTVADDYPLVVDADGLAVTVTAVSGSSSPQTFTVTSATVARDIPAGATVSVLRPGLLAKS